MGAAMDRAPFIFQGVRSYIQGPGASARIGAHLSRLAAGQRVCILIDQTVASLLGVIRKSMEEARIDFRAFEFDGDLRRANVEALAQRIRAEYGPGVVLGVGGGKTIDAAKIVSARIAARCAVLATSSSTDAAPSHAAVLVDDHHQISAEALDRNPDIVVVDSAVIAAAPARLFISGIGDAISKKYEMNTALRQGELNSFGGKPVFFLPHLAAALHDTLLESGEAAVRSVEKGLADEAVERVITACILLSCLVWENGGLAGAHSIANVLFNAGWGDRNLHGELVAFSLLVLLVLEERRDDLRSVSDFYTRIRLPRTISSLGVAFEDTRAVMGLCDAVHERYRKHGLLYSAQRIYEAVEELERGGQ